MNGGSLSYQYNELPHGPSINDLPDELLVRIMSHLPLFHRKRIREVCSHWEFISYETSLIRDDWMVVPSVKDLKKLEDRAPYKKFLNLRIEEVKDDPVEMSVWQKFGPFIKNIEFDVSYNRYQVFTYHIFKYCNNLKGLFFKTYKNEYERTRNNECISLAELMPNDALSTLTSIMLEDLDGTFTNAEFNALTRNSLHLTSIYLQHCSSVSIENIRNLLARQSKKLTHLALSKINVNEEVLSDLLSCVGSQLTSLELSSLGLLHDECLRKVCGLFPNLEEIDLTETKISCEGAKMVFSSLKRLNSVVFYNTKLTNFPIGNMLDIKNLKSIKLSKIRGIPDDELIAAFGHRPLPNLETLIFDGLRTVSDEVVLAISPMIPNVRHLDLSFTGVTAYGVQSIINYCKGLRFLSLQGCCSVSEMLPNFPSINDLTELRDLEIDFWPGVDESSIESLSLKRLRKLTLNKCYRRGNRTPWPTSCFATLIEGCPSLEIIELPYQIYPNGIDTRDLSPRARKMLPLPCRCNFSPEKHLTQKCQF